MVCFAFIFIRIRRDSFSGLVKENQDIAFEEASILYNIASLHSVLGSKESRVNADVSLLLFFLRYTSSVLICTCLRL